MEIGFAIDTDMRKMRIGFRSYGFQPWPGVEESGSSSPAQYFDSPCGDKYWLWSWLWFVFFYAEGF